MGVQVIDAGVPSVSWILFMCTSSGDCRGPAIFQPFLGGRGIHLKLIIPRRRSQKGDIEIALSVRPSALIALDRYASVH